MDVIFYTRAKCQLCIEASELLNLLQSEYGFTIITRDIDTNDMWNEAYGIMIPVIEVDGDVIQYGQIDLYELDNFFKSRLR